MDSQTSDLTGKRRVKDQKQESSPKLFWRYILENVPSLFSTVKITLLTVFLIYIGIPIFVKSNSWIMPRVVFANIMRWPPFVNLSSPADFGLNNTRNFYLHVENGITLGSWHILPKSMSEEQVPLENYENLLANGKKVFLYLHGNSGTRGSHHRVQLYKLLAALDFHVLAFDYRGYGDSSGVPTEEGVVSDAYFAFKWLKKRTGQSKIFLWGHSLGTGVTTKLAKILCDEGDYPSGVILESPFNNMRDAATYHPFAFPFRKLPWFEWSFLQGIREQGIYFNSDESISSVTPHIMILHARDDLVVPFDLGKKLYLRAQGSRSEKTKTVDFVEFESHLGYGHKLIYQAPEMADLIRDFMVKAETEE